MATAPLAPDALLRTMIGAGDHLWSVGTLSAFVALPVGKVQSAEDSLILSADGCIARLRPHLPAEEHLLAFETLSSDPRGWNHGIAVCLPKGAGISDRHLYAVEDHDPIFAADRGWPVLSLGVGQGAARALFRAAEGMPELSGMRWAKAAPMLAQIPGTWIIEPPFLRVELQKKDGIGFHSVEQALATGRSHAETTPVADGLIPVAHVFPPHPARHNPGRPMPFDPARHARFQAVLARHGRRDLWALKADVLAQLQAGRFDPPQTDRHGAAVVRVALRQSLHLRGMVPEPWLERFDRPLLRALKDGPG